MKKLNRHGIVAAKISYNNYKENSEYFCIEALEDGLQAKLSVNTCEYSLDGNTWNILSAATNTPAVNTGDKIYFRGDLTPTSSSGIGTFTISKKCNLSGNIMSLLYGDNFEEQTDLTGKSYAFDNLFYRCTTIIDASQLILPATTLAEYCYSGMFQNCTSLVTAPELPATTLASECYSGMFSICTSLTQAPSILPATTLVYKCYRSMFTSCASLVTAPELPATTLARECYGYMFHGCSSLTQAPELPATTLADSCYRSMFNGCTKLNYIKALFTTTPSTSYTYSWVSGVSSTGTFVKNAKAIWDVTGANGIPSGWTVETI